MMPASALEIIYTRAAQKMINKSSTVQAETAARTDGAVICFYTIMQPFVFDTPHSPRPQKA
jgi:hypothetical protein